MKVLKWIIAIVIIGPLLLFGVIYGASELGGEVAILERNNESGEATRVRVWIVDEVFSSLIEHGDVNSHWITHLQTSDRVTLERDGEVISYKGTADPAAHDTYHKLRREKYGWADKTLEALGGKAADCDGIPVRLVLI